MRRPSEPTACEHGVRWEYDCEACWLDACSPEDDEVMLLKRGESMADVKQSPHYDLLVELGEFVQQVYAFRCVRSHEEGDTPFNVCDYYAMEDLMARLARVGVELPAQPQSLLGEI